MGQRRAAAQASVIDILDRVARGVVVDSHVPVSATLAGLRRVDGAAPVELAPRAAHSAGGDASAGGGMAGRATGDPPISG